ncbi:hypothetical protein Anapl_00617 [Anas platyrhynchos]|uniref:Uncharacterized protein n=1 Tax=Anas platyrhynchos TaxID=8839 RepID=R0K0Z4_ANAPL|nr:hypothetical protein Anapl_00617 [Anas platyrhynchos]
MHRESSFGSCFCWFKNNRGAAASAKQAAGTRGAGGEEPATLSVGLLYGEPAAEDQLRNPAQCTGQKQSLTAKQETKSLDWPAGHIWHLCSVQGQGGVDEASEPGAGAEAGRRGEACSAQRSQRAALSPCNTLGSSLRAKPILTWGLQALRDGEVLVFEVKLLKILPQRQLAAGLPGAQGENLWGAHLGIRAGGADPDARRAAVPWPQLLTDALMPGVKRGQSLCFAGQDDKAFLSSSI